MITRKLKKDTDLQQFSQVSSTAYIHPASETTFDENCDIFGTFLDDGKTLISQIESTFRNCWYDKSLISCAMVGGVASRPEFRRMGGVRETFKKIFENAIEKGAVISILYPFSLNYYRQFGYDTIFHYLTATSSFDSFKEIERCTDVILLKEDNKETFFDAYTTVCKSFNMMLERKDFSNFSLEPYETSKFTYFINENNSKGYISFLPVRATRTLNVSEIAYTDKTALLKLLGFLRSYEGNYDKVCFEKLPKDSAVLEVLNNDNRLITRTLYKGGSGRILDVNALLQLTNYPQTHGSFSLKVTDQQIEQNNAIYRVEYENGKCTIKKDLEGDYDLGVDALSCARLLLGREGLSLDEISYLPGVEIKNNCEDFLRAFPKLTTQFFDDF